MGSQEKGTMTIVYMNGTVHRFEYPREEDIFSVAARIQEALSANHLLLELEDRALIIPFQNIQTIEIKPSPAKLPQIAVRNVHAV